jgi:hypothetical protein
MSIYLFLKENLLLSTSFILQGFYKKPCGAKKLKIREDRLIAKLKRPCAGTLRKPGFIAFFFIV